MIPATVPVKSIPNHLKTKIMKVHIFTFNTVDDTVNFRNLLDSSTLSYDLDFVNKEAQFTVKYQCADDIRQVIRRFIEIDKKQALLKSVQNANYWIWREAESSFYDCCILLKDRYSLKQFIELGIDEIESIKKLNEVEEELKSLGYDPSEFDHLEKADL